MQPQWFTPLRLLAIFCAVNLFVYLDRGLIASNGVNGSQPSEENPNGTGIQGDMGLSYFQDGLLPAAFMVGLLIAAPIFSELSKTRPPFKLVAVGMGVWSLACLSCAAAPSFAVLLLARAAVGVGEASFVALAQPFIDDYAPKGHSNLWFAAFNLCVPVGFALGYILGGLVAASTTWRVAFVIEAVPMIPFVLFAALSKPLRLKGGPEEGKGRRNGGTGAALQAFWIDIKRVLSLKIWLLAAIAFTLYVAVLGCYAYWGPQAGHRLFFDPSDKSAQADLVFGGVTVLTGVAGTVAGGLLLDKLGATLKNAFLICVLANFAGFIFVTMAFVGAKSFMSFMVLFGIGQCFIFLLQAPIVGIGMWTVPSSLRALSVSLLTIVIHLFGDVPSPPLVGLLQSHIQDWRVTMTILSSLLIASGVFFLTAAFLTSPAADFRTHQSEVKIDEEESRTLLLDESDSTSGSSKA
jgi:MFS family permease